MDDSILSEETSQMKIKEELAPEEMLPKLTKDGYNLSPAIHQLSRMTEEELSAVENFCIWNQFAKVKFEDDVDLRNLDIDRIVNFQKTFVYYFLIQVELYPDTEFEEDEKPSLGEELNKPATIIYYNREIPTDPKTEEQMELSKYMRKLKVWAKKSNINLIAYDEDEKTLEVKVDHF